MLVFFSRNGINESTRQTQFTASNDKPFQSSCALSDLVTSKLLLNWFFWLICVPAYGCLGKSTEWFLFWINQKYQKTKQAVNLWEQFLRKFGFSSRETKAFRAYLSCFFFKKTIKLAVDTWFYYWLLNLIRFMKL